MFDKEELQQIIARNEQNQSHVDALNQLGFLVRRDALLRANAYYHQALALAQQLDYAKGIANSKTGIAFDEFIFKGDWQQAYQLLLEAIPVLKHHKDYYWLGLSLMLQSMIHKNSGQFDKAFKILKEGISYQEIINTNEGLAWSNYIMGSHYQDLGDNENALKYFGLSESCFEKINDPGGYATTLAGIGNIFANQGKYKEALKQYEKSLQITKNHNLESDEARTLNDMGYLYSTLGETKKARAFFELSLGIREKSNNYQGIITCHQGLANVEIYDGNISKALDHLQKAETLAIKVNANNKLLKILQKLSEVFKAQKEYALALEHFERYADLKATIMGEENNLQLQNMKAFVALEEAEKQTAIEKNKNAELQQAYLSIEKEKEKSESLLLNILPRETVIELKEKGYASAKSYEQVTVLFTDFKDFTTISEKLSPEDLVNELNMYFWAFDEITEKYGLEKIKTIGDAYMCVGGLCTNEGNQPVKAVQAAIEMQQYMYAIRGRNSEICNSLWDLRIGIHTGPVVAGVVGKNKFAYDIWGDTVNIASRMESAGEPGKINISAATHALIKDHFKCIARGRVAAKNKGEMEMYFVENLSKEIPSENLNLNYIKVPV